MTRYRGHSKALDAPTQRVIEALDRSCALTRACTARTVRGTTPTISADSQRCWSWMPDWASFGFSDERRYQQLLERTTAAA